MLMSGDTYFSSIFEDKLRKKGLEQNFSDFFLNLNLGLSLGNG